MADITASGILYKKRISVGNVYLHTCMITGDGSGITYQVPLSSIITAWMSLASPTGAGTINAALTMTWSGNTITFSAAPTNARVFMLHVLGTD